MKNIETTVGIYMYMYICLYLYIDESKIYNNKKHVTVCRIERKRNVDAHNV
jgi:hypothetical protein